MKVRVLSPVHREIVEAMKYLEGRAGLGAEFFDLVYQQLDAIEGNPFAFPLWEMNTIDVEIRRVILTRFQYVIYFQIVRDEAVILSVSHGKRDAGVWLGRVQRTDD